MGLDNRHGPQPPFDATDLARLLRALEAGTPVRAVAEAFGVDVRTVYRYVGGRLEYLEVDGWTLAFLCRPGRRPVEVAQRRGPTKVRS